MDAEKRREALGIIEEEQHDSSPVTVTIGGINKNTNIVQSKYLYLQDASTSVINALQNNGFKVSMTEHGLRVNHY